LPFSFAQAFGEALGGEATVDVVKAGHWPFVDRPELVDRIAGFLAG
jgi:hypothetical protein